MLKSATYDFATENVKTTRDKLELRFEEERKKRNLVGCNIDNVNDHIDSLSKKYEVFYGCFSTHENPFKNIPGHIVIKETSEYMIFDFLEDDEVLFMYSLIYNTLSRQLPYSIKEYVLILNNVACYECNERYMKRKVLWRF